MDRVERTAETERLRSALLTSISHDLKTPLAAVLGSAGTLRDLGDKLPTSEKAELLGTIIDESERLNRFIANLLDMTKLESGAITPNVAPHDLGEIVGSALRRASRFCRHHKVELDLAPDLPMLRTRRRAVRAGAVQSSRQCRQICRRRTRPSASSTWRDQRRGLPARSLDEGSGIPQPDLEHIFDKFYRAQKTDQVRAGTGLGLAISRGFVEAMHGTIVAANRSDRRGAMFTITCRSRSEPQRLDAAA